MDTSLIVILILSAIIIYQQVYFMRQIQKLIDKLMSRSFGEYQQATKPKDAKVKLETEAPEDLRILQSFSI